MTSAAMAIVRVFISGSLPSRPAADAGSLAEMQAAAPDPHAAAPTCCTPGRPADSTSRMTRNGHDGATARRGSLAGKDRCSRGSPMNQPTATAAGPATPVILRVALTAGRDGRRTQ
jgi:hypothetical protein